jgi:hypothetical protein
MSEEKYKGYSLQDKQAVIRDALRRMEPVHSHWRMLESLYRTGAQRELTQIDLSRILPFPAPGVFLRTVNMVLPHLTMIINTVSARDPKFVVTPTGGDVTAIERNAQIAQTVLAYFWKRADATSTLRDMAQDMVLLGNGFAKIGWSYTEKTMDRTPEDYDSELTDKIMMAQEEAGMQGMELDEETVAAIVESVALNQQLVDEDEPYVEYVSPYDIFLPANARRMNTARWVAQRVRLPLATVQANEMFDKQAVKDLKADTGYADNETIVQYEQLSEALPSAFSHVTLIEFYDMQEHTLCIFQLDGERYLYEGKNPHAHRYPPFVHMRNFNDGGMSFWSFGDLENIAGIQLMINEIMVAELNDLRRVGNKYFINKKVMTPEVTKALMSNQPDQVIPLELPSNVGIGEVLVPVQRMATPADNYVMEDKLQSYMQRILGVTDFQAGIISSSNRTPATAAAAVEGASTTRAMDKMTNVEKASREIAVRMLGLCQQFLDAARALRIAGPNAPTWLEVSEDDIEGEFFIDVEGGSTQAINPATRYRQGQEMITQIVPMLAQLGYDTEPALRAAISYMGMNPEHVLVKPEPVPQPLPDQQMAGMEQPMEQPMAPEQGGQMPADMMAMFAAQAAPAAGNEATQQVMDMGGAPLPGATEGGTLF